MRLSNPEAASWLRRLDSYTNAEFGRSRTLCAIQDVCVACGQPKTRQMASGSALDARHSASPTTARLSCLDR